MPVNIDHEIATLKRMSPSALRGKYAELFGEPSRSGNKTWLVRRIAWRLQALAEGGLSERARRRAEELANEADLRILPPRVKTAATEPSEPVLAMPPKKQKHAGLPMPGSIITRLYKGKTLQVKVLRKGFEYDGVVHKSLSAVAKAITGSHCNGFLFFRLGQYGESA